MARVRPAPVLPAWLWLWFPPLLLLVIFPVRIVDPAGYRSWVDGELGLIELATPVLAIAGAVIGLRLLRQLWRERTSPLLVWVLLMTLACVYFAGEELSWGQHLFGWSTPEAFEQINDQQETNLHNISSWFDQKPRLLLEIWVLVGGIIVPLRGLEARGPIEPRRISSWIWPTLDCTPTAILAILIRAPERIKDAASLESLPYELRYSEPQEYYFALFLLIYLASLGARVRAGRG
ncbi:MAG: hypothetical protein ACU85V_03280 [Gammaproteobacteria bacterium]